MGTVDKRSNERIIPLKERRRLRDKRIRSLYASGYSMDEIVSALGASKTTVFYAVNRPKKKGAKRK
jgi:transposase